MIKHRLLRTTLVFVFIMLLIGMQETYAQTRINEQLYYHGSRGLSFIPPLSRPGLVYNGKLYVGKKKLSSLFQQLKDEQLNIKFQKYKANKTAADLFGFAGNVILPLVNIFLSANQGKVNWWMVGAAASCNITGSVLNLQAQNHLLTAAMYYDQKKITTTQLVPAQTTIGFIIPLSK